jgi:peptidoglycan-N-acetylglucosamine deacetylase
MMRIIPEKTSVMSIAAIVWFASCLNLDRLETTGTSRGAVVLTFDDTYVAEWYAVDAVLRKYHWKATFCVCCINSIPDDGIVKLCELQSQGHEIAAHGLAHINAVDFVSTHSIQAYLDTDIVPLLQIMQNKGLIARTFAYPAAASNDSLDQALFKYFSILRGATLADGTKPLDSQECFVRGKKIVYGLGIDIPYRCDDSYLLRLIDYAHQNNDTVVLMSHGTENIIPSDTVTSLVTAYSTLEKICRRVVDCNMRFLTLDELSAH